MNKEEKQQYDQIRYKKNSERIYELQKKWKSTH